MATPQRTLSRRRFLTLTAVAGGGLVLGFRLPWPDPTAEAQGGPQLNAWLRIAADDTVTVFVPNAEMGQGVYTSLPMILADELEADWSKIRVEFAPVAVAYRNPVARMQMTGGSTSVSTQYDRLRHAGAAAREMLVAAAAEAWGVPPGECVAENGAVLHPPTGRRVTCGAVAEAAAKLPPPAQPRLKSRDQFKLIGRRVKRLDTPAKVDGTAVFAIDVRAPEMLSAAVKTCPVFGGTVGSVDATSARAMAGVRAVVDVPNGIAVVADSYWQARRALDAVRITWDEGPNGRLDSAAISRMLRDGLKEPGALAHRSGDVPGAFARAARVVEARYEVPFLAHATMEPMSCNAHVTAEGCDIWAPTQGPELAREVAARLTGLPLEKVRIHTTFLGGGFGRRFETDFVVQAVLASRAVGRPVKVVWSREEDLQHDFYRPASVSHLRAALDARGRVVGWTNKLVLPSILQRRFDPVPTQAITTGFPDLVKGGVDVTSVEGAAQLPYAIANRQLHYVVKETGVPVGFWRSVGSSHNAFHVESFLDEIAAATRADPYRLRRELLAAHPRYVAVLDLVARKAGWGTRLPAERGRGIAIHESFGSIVGEVAEVSVARAGRVRVHRVVCVIDCGQVVNPDTVEAQMESGIVFGLTAALKGEITIRNGRVVQSNFHDYPMLHMEEMPAIETHIIESGAPMGGVGEPSTPPIAPAVANAVYAATGRRLRRLPIRAEDLRRRA